jgi:5-methylcytosine-specific restriction endonuclease McrA
VVRHEQRQHTQTSTDRPSTTGRKLGKDLQQGYRAEAAKWYKSKQWQQLRQHILAKQPYCQCIYHKGQDRTALSEVVDHITPHRGDKRTFFNATNLQALTKHCHDKHKQRQERSGVIAGTDSQGNPIDPSANWWA